MCDNWQTINTERRFHILVSLTVTWFVISSYSLSSVDASKGNDLYFIFQHNLIFQSRHFELHLISNRFRIKLNILVISPNSTILYAFIFGTKKTSSFDVAVSGIMSQLGCFWTWCRYIYDLLYNVINLGKLIKFYFGNKKVVFW